MTDPFGITPEVAKKLGAHDNLLTPKDDFTLYNHKSGRKFKQWDELVTITDIGTHTPDRYPELKPESVYIRTQVDITSDSPNAGKFVPSLWLNFYWQILTDLSTKFSGNFEAFDEANPDLRGKRIAHIISNKKVKDLLRATGHQNTLTSGYLLNGSQLIEAGLIGCTVGATITQRVENQNDFPGEDQKDEILWFKQA